MSNAPVGNQLVQANCDPRFGFFHLRHAYLEILSLSVMSMSSCFVVSGRANERGKSTVANKVPRSMQRSIRIE
jgi:hypothetical protein